MFVQSLKEAALRYIGLLINSEDEWNVIASEKPPVTDVLFPFTTMGFILFIIAAAAGYFLRSARTSFVLELLLTMAVYIVPLAVFIVCTTFLARSMQAVRQELACAACLYSFSPAWIISIFHVIPVISFGWLWIIISLIFVSILFAKATTSVLGVPDGKKNLFILINLATLALTMCGGFAIKHLWLLSKEIF